MSTDVGMELVEQDQDKRQTIKFVVDKLWAGAKAWKFLYAGHNHSNWISDIKWVKGQQHTNKASDDGKIKATFNLSWANIQKELPFMTDRMPKIYVEPMEPSDKYAAELFQMIMATKWVQRDMDKKIPEGTLNAKELGTNFYRPFWNPELDNGLGDVDCEVVDPIECFPFAYTHEMTKEKCEGFVWARNVSLGWIRKNYPKEGWRVKSWTDPSVVDRAKETAVANQKSDDYVQVGDIGTSTGYTSVETNYLPSAGGGDMRETDLKRCTLIKCYLKDDSLEDEDKKDKKKKSLYPLGRVITIAGGVVLADESFQWEFFPGFVEQRNYIQPSEFWGESDVSQIKEINKIYNKLFSMLAESVRRGVYTQKFIDIRSGIDPDEYVTTEDAVYPTKIPNPITESVPQALPMQAFSMVQSLQQILGTIAGTVDYNPPQTGDLPSGRALAEMNEITQTRLRQKIRNLEYSVRKIGSAWLEILLKNYTEDRTMRLINPSTNESEWAFIFKEDDPQKAEIIKQKAKQEVIPGTEQKDPKTGQVVNPGKPKFNHILNIAEIKGNFDLTVATGSTVSISKYATFDQSALLYKLGAIDKQALLDSAEYPNRNDILRRMSEQAQMAQQAQMQAQQGEMQMEAQMKQGDQQLEKRDQDVDMEMNKLDNQTRILLQQLKEPVNKEGKSL